MKFGSSSEITIEASKLAAVLDSLKQRNSDIIVVGKMACQVLLGKTSLSADCMIENASVVWEFLKGRKLPGLMALDRVCFLDPKSVCLLFFPLIFPLFTTMLPFSFLSVWNLKAVHGEPLFFNLCDIFHSSISYVCLSAALWTLYARKRKLKWLPFWFLQHDILLPND